MDGFSSVLPFPVSGGQTRTKTRVDHRSTEEAALVRRVQAHDEIAFREIVERYQAKVFAIIYGILRNHNDAEDIAQQVFAKIYFSMRNFDFRSSLLTWIYKITVNECFDYLRKKRFASWSMRAISPKRMRSEWKTARPLSTTDSQWTLGSPNGTWY